MAKSISVLFAASEIFPYVKFGGIADFSFSYTLALRGLGHDVRVMMPRYGNISERKYQIHFIKRLQDIPIKIAERNEVFTVKSSSITNSRYKVQSYITTNSYYFDQRKGIYHDPITKKPYGDNDERFTLFSYSVIKTCLLLNWFPEILHINDWYLALVPGFAKILYPNKFKKTKFVLTVHNFANQGEFPEKTFDKLGLPSEIKSNFIHNGKVNFLKAGLLYSDYITTVSPTYAQEVLQNSEYTGGLNEILLNLNGKFSGILNGIDPYQWNPHVDNDIACTLNDSNFEQYKQCNKEDLLKQLGLPFSFDIPIVGMISNLDVNKGIRLLLDAIDKIMKEDLILVLLGTGEPDLTRRLERASQKYPNKFIFKNIFDEKLAHQIEAGSDMFLMPSLYEPCGYNAMYSIAYGTVPIVRATGGLVDSIEPFDPDKRTGTGFVFAEPSSAALISILKQALSAYRNKEIWNDIIKNCLQKQFFWENTIDQYVEIYRQLIKT